LWISSYGLFLDRRPNLQIEYNFRSAVRRKIILAYHCIVVIKRSSMVPLRAQPFVKVGGGGGGTCPPLPHGAGTTASVSSDLKALYKCIIIIIIIIITVLLLITA